LADQAKPDLAYGRIEQIVKAGKPVFVSDEVFGVK
jgi:hypothetical protein